MRILPCGGHALLVECERDADVLVLARAVERSAREGTLRGVEELVPAARTLLLLCAPGADLAEIAASVRLLDRAVSDVAAGGGPEPEDTAGGEVVTLDVVYDGPDLDEVAAVTGSTPEAVVATHTALVWTVAFCGFAPGFGYLRAPGDPLVVGRHASPRTRVPAGSVGLAGPYSGVYPTPSPGGWQLIGHTDAALWDAARTPPALLVPGTHVRFRSLR